ncbi:MAG: hypothetical protein A3F84_06460 [Candidatus Handelsmanbacteria bacterium RIFCSPLOWO2_12_FULL_64_10]|uniref:Tyr recombinase domain-containing protein n=1 Tax=Handelsmanbacteria sp. (strain RIFCSPLOWO2_12_FULL_64_10) TaxID=1817868 RepID=A0A1F6D2C0_HANXR|nr:MAG: hypothetical protein A3F84_06460 [Candidatus Handelsmanbacteria bacterium RIFCSPLOWO2_12_FULL_64_10]
MFLTNLASRSTTATRVAAQEALPASLRPAAKMIRGLWAESTWSRRAALLLRVNTFAREQQLLHLPLGVQMTAFVSNQRVAASTVASYASALGSTARRLGQQVPMLDLLGAAARGAGSTTPMRQARPATRLQLFFLVNRLLRNSNNRMAVAVWLVWKTASRWDDMRHLTRSSFLNLASMHADNFLVIQWGRTKTNRRQEFRPDGWTAVVEEDPELAWLWALTQRTIARLRSASEPLLPPSATTEALRRLLRAYPETQQLVGHSFKRGAVNALVEAAVERRLDPHLIPLLAKHKDALHGFPTTTLRYVEDKVKLALMLGTQNATRLL